MEVFDHILCRAIKADAIPHPGPCRTSVPETRRAREARCRFWPPPERLMGVHSRSTANRREP